MVKNTDLWRAVDAEAEKHKMEWRWVKGHSGNVHNERCDVLAVLAIAEIRKKLTSEQLKEELRRFIAEQEAKEREFVQAKAEAHARLQQEVEARKGTKLFE